MPRDVVNETARAAFGDATVRPVHSRRDLLRFIAFPYTLYRGSRYWVPPLRRDQARLLDRRTNPFFAHGDIQPFLAVDGSNRVVGRIAAVLNEAHTSRFDDGAGFFGFFECVRNYDVARKLFDAAGNWLRGHHLNVLRGPTNPSINETSGLLVAGFDRSPSVLMPYNPPYYVEYVREYGFTAAQSMWAYHAAWKHLNIERLRRGAELVRQRLPGLNVRNLELARFDAEVGMLHRLYNESFAEGWGQVPMTEAEFAFAAAAMKPIIDTRVVFAVEYEGRPVGFSLTLPNVNRVLKYVPDGRLFPFGLLKLLLRSRFSDITEVRTMLIGVKPEFQRRGVDTLLILSTIEAGRNAGYDASELSWVMDDNVVLKNSLRKLGAVVDKEYAIYEIDL